MRCEVFPPPTIVLAAASAHWVLVDSQNNETTLNEKNNTNPRAIKASSQSTPMPVARVFFWSNFPNRVSSDASPPPPPPLSSHKSVCQNSGALANTPPNVNGELWTEAFVSTGRSYIGPQAPSSECHHGTWQPVGAGKPAPRRQWTTQSGKNFQKAPRYPSPLLPTGIPLNYTPSAAEQTQLHASI